MPDAKQAGKTLRHRLIDRDLTVTKLAKQISRPRSSVSRAINQGKHPRVLREVKEALGV